jgi:hypothetical protein
LAGLLALTAVGVVALLWNTGRSVAGGLFFLSVPMAVAWAFVLILGLRSFTDEFRHGSIVPTLLASPHRRRVLAAKLVVTVGAAVVFALAAAGLSLAIGLPWLIARDMAIEAPIGPLAVWFAKLLLINVLWSAIGVGVGLGAPSGRGDRGDARGGSCGGEHRWWNRSDDRQSAAGPGDRLRRRIEWGAADPAPGGGRPRCLGGGHGRARFCDDGASRCRVRTLRR